MNVTLTKRTPSQVGQAVAKLNPTSHTATTVTWENTTPAELIAKINSLGLGRADGSVPISGIRRALEALPEPQPEVTPVPKAKKAPKAKAAPAPTPEPEAPAFSEDPKELVQLAKAEKKALDAWKRSGSEGTAPSTANLDELNRQYAAGVTAKDRKAAKAPKASTPRHTDPRVVAAYARKKAEGKRGPGRKITDEELDAYARSVFPGAGRGAEMEVAYWGESLAITRPRWYTKWAELEAEAGVAIAS